MENYGLSDAPDAEEFAPPGSRLGIRGTPSLGKSKQHCKSVFENASRLDTNWLRAYSGGYHCLDKRAPGIGFTIPKNGLGCNLQPRYQNWLTWVE